METRKFEFFFKKFEIEFCPYPEFPYAEKRNHLSFEEAKVISKVILPPGKNHFLIFY